jgi:hypothetical protein
MILPCILVPLKQWPVCKVIHVHVEQLGETKISKHSQHFATMSRKCHCVAQSVVLAVVVKGCDNVLLHSIHTYRTMFSASKYLLSCVQYCTAYVFLFFQVLVW